jgi:hypothetical protein
LICCLGKFDFSRLKDAKLIASLLICFFLELPEPLIPPKLLEQFLEAQSISNSNTSEEYIRQYEI